MRRALFSAALLVAAAPLLAHGLPRGSATATIAGKAVAIDYGRPSLKGRDMLAQAKAGEPWRMGADAPTTLKTDADLSFGAASVPQGSYVLTATKDAQGGWTLNVLSADRRKVADVPLAARTLPANVETLTIDLAGTKDGGTFVISWGTTALEAAFTAK